MDKIKISDILLKAKCSSLLEEFPNLKAAIKEIVELVVDKCAEEGKTKWKYKEHLGDIKIVDKDSILKVKEEILYE